MKPGLFLFISLSATAHLAAFNLSSVWMLDIDKRTEQGSSSISVEITHSKPAIIKPDVSPVKQPRIIATQKTLTKPITTQQNNEPLPERTLSSISQITPVTNRIDINKTVIIDKNHSVLQGNLDDLLKTELNKYFYYPKAAIRRNWQGNLIVTFTLDADGQISNIQIAKSSGYDILDRAALNSVKQIKLPIRNQFTLSQTTLKSIPVSFQLN